MPNKTVLAPAMHCEQCKARIESEIAKLPGVDGVYADLASKSVHVSWNAPQAWPTIADRLSELGYPPQLLHEIKRHVAIVLYDGFTALNAVGPYEVLVSLPDTQVHFIADQHGPVWTDTGQLGLVATATWNELPNPQIILIPGGSGTMKAAQNQALLTWLKGAHATSEWTTSVCIGAFVLGAIGILQGLDVTTHWGSRDYIQQYCGATYVAQRFIQQGKSSLQRASLPGSIWRSSWPKS